MKVNFLRQIIDSDQCKWVAEFGVGGNKFGVNPDGEWIFESINGQIQLDSNTNYTPFLPILETTRHEFLAHIKSLGLSDLNLASFPERQILLCAINYPASSYWLEKALAWINYEPTLTFQVFSALDSKKNCLKTSSESEA